MKPAVCLITPPSTFLLDERVFVSLGILRVAAVLERAMFHVEHLDLSGIENYEEAVSDYASRTTATVFGLTATTPQMPATTKILSRLRRGRPGVRLVLGGPHATLVAAARRREAKAGTPGRATVAFQNMSSLVDVVVAGDGEGAIFRALEDEPPAFIDADDPKSDLWLTDESYETLPFPARHLVDMDSYHYSVEGERATSMIAQLGCPFECSFCGGRLSSMLRRIRTRSTWSVVAEIRHLFESYGVRGIMMYDDELNVNKQCVQLMRAIADLGRDLGIEFRLRGFIKAELFTEEQAEAMHAAGFRWILVGFESGSPRVLTNINKKATREDNSRCLAIARRHGLKVKALMSIGHPGENFETVQQTRDWLLEEKPDDFDCTVISCYPGTPYYDHAIQTSPDVWTYTVPRTGDKLHAVDVDYSTTADAYKGVPGDYRAYVFTDYLRSQDLVALRDSLESDVRRILGIPFNSGAPGVRYEASMGQFPGHILRHSINTGVAACA
jgi:radical SAM superfamily enzyme YgiQ (UPF0313 family)